MYCQDLMVLKAIGEFLIFLLKNGQFMQAKWILGGVWEEI